MSGYSTNFEIAKDKKIIIKKTNGNIVKIFICNLTSIKLIKTNDIE